MSYLFMATAFRFALSSARFSMASNGDSRERDDSLVGKNPVAVPASSRRQAITNLQISDTSWVDFPIDLVHYAVFQAHGTSALPFNHGVAGQ